MDITEQAQKIIDSYKELPPAPIVRESMSNELAHLIVNYLMSKQEDIEKFNFEEFFSRLKFPEDLLK